MEYDNNTLLLPLGHIPFKRLARIGDHNEATRRETTQPSTIAIIA
jgi:hypothetical protein